MPWAPRTPCGVTGCPHRKPCPVHPPRPYARQVRVSPGRHDPAWAAVCRQVRLEEATCRACGEPGAVVDHIVPLARGGANTRENAQRLCRRCHASKTGKEVRGR